VQSVGRLCRTDSPSRRGHLAPFANWTSRCTVVHSSCSSGALFCVVFSYTSIRWFTKPSRPVGRLDSITQTFTSTQDFHAITLLSFFNLPTHPPQLKNKFILTCRVCVQTVYLLGYVRYGAVAPVCDRDRSLLASQLTSRMGHGFIVIIVS
jgi:hypothetical protein